MIVVCLAGLTACAQETSPPADATAGFCVGLDKTHPADARATVRFTRGDVTFGSINIAVTGPVEVPVTPGEVTVYVDDTVAATMTVSAGNTVYARTGTGCPATL